MARFNYETLLGDNVLFKQGTQAALNDYLPTSSDATKKGKAIEGAFYLTTDTHRLYIGRKVSAVPSPNPYNVAINDVYPEEVSSGIATVADTGQLAQIQTGGAAHDGDFYYIKDSNVLAVYEESGSGGTWQQINSPTGIDTFTANVSTAGPSDTPTFTSGSTYVKVKESLKPQGVTTTTDSEFWLKAGDNITLKASSENNAIEISSANSQSSLTLTDSAASANKAKTTLSDGINFDSNLFFVGASDTTATAENIYKASTDTSVVANKAYYTRSGVSAPYTYTLVTAPTGNPVTNNYYEKESTITITGPGIKGTVINALGTAGSDTGSTGFRIGVQVQDGAKTDTTTDKVITTAGIANSYLDPIIRVGDGTTTDINFRGGRADLPVYTKAQTDTAISTAVTDALKGVDALHYKGTIGSSTALGNLDDGTLEIGDVYKASADFSYSPDGVNQVSVKTGDILIAQGTEDSNGYIATGTVTWTLVPSGDEPVLAGFIVNTNTSGAGPQFGLEDKNIAGQYNSTATEAVRLAKRPLGIQIDNASSTLIKAASTGTSADQMKITLHHQAPASGSVTTVTSATITANSGTDSLTTKNQVVSFVALSSITRDAYGHTTDVAGQTITLKHNYLTAFNTTHSAGTTSTGTYGQALVGASDTFGFSNDATKAAVKIASDSLNITAAQDNTQMNINLVWQSF